MDRELSDRFTELYKRYNDLMYSVSYSVLHDRENARDAVQDAFMKLMTRPVRLECESAAKALLIKTVRNVSIDMLKRERRHTVLSETEETGETADFTERYDEPKTSDMIATLPEHLRRTVELRFIYGMTARETSDILGVKPAVVQSRIRLSRRLIREAVTA